MDLIRKIHPPSSKHHVFIIVATNYFTKWVEAQLLVNVTQVDVIKLIKTQIMYQFGVPETITMDRVLYSQGETMKIFAQQLGFWLVHSSPYYA